MNISSLLNNIMFAGSRRQRTDIALGRETAECRQGRRPRGGKEAEKRLKDVTAGKLGTDGESSPTDDDLLSFPIEGLPVEVLQNIVEFCDQRTLRSLRFTNSLLSSLSTRFFFRSIKISIHGPLARSTRDDYSYYSGKGNHKEKDKIRTLQKKAIYSYQDLPFLFNNVRDLNIRHYGEGEESLKEEQRKMPCWPLHSKKRIEALQVFICRMKNLRVLRWSVTFGNIGKLIDLSAIAPSVQELCIDHVNPLASFDERDHVPPFLCPAFKVFQNITKLDIVIYDPQQVVTFNYLPHLRRLVFGPSEYVVASVIDFFAAQTVPFELQELVLKDYGFSADCTIRGSFPEYLVEKFLSKLQCLTGVSGGREGSEVDIWQHFKKYNVHLRHIGNIIIYNESASLIDYLASYSDTVEHLDMEFERYRCDDRSTVEECTAEHDTVLRFMDSFWEKAISNHAKTIKSLHIFPGSIHSSPALRVKSPSRTFFFGRSAPQTIDQERGGPNDRLLFHEPWGVTPVATKALVGCNKLETFQTGSASHHGLAEAIKAAVRMKGLKRLQFNMRGYRQVPNFSFSRCGNPQMEFHNIVGGIRRQIDFLRWDDAEEVPEHAWRQLMIDIVPISAMQLVREEEGGGKRQWKLASAENRRLEDKKIKRYSRYYY